MRLTILLVTWIGLAAACDGEPPPPGPGDQTFTPPNQQQGTGRPPGATDQACGAASECAFWYCRCADGAVVNSALCVNGYCMDAESACPQACAYFMHGDWTGVAGGGPGSQPPSTCGGLGSQSATCDACFRESCCEEGDSCGRSAACLDYWDCAVACNGDADCRFTCDERFPGGATPYLILEACLFASCGGACAP